MDPTKKRKLDENGVVPSSTEIDPSLQKLTPEDVRKIVDRIDKDKLIDIVAAAAARHVDVLDGVRALADSDTSQRKLFIRGLGWDTTTDGLRSLFSSYGEIEEAVVILDKQTGKSKGYGFVTFKHVDGAFLALKEPSKRIDGRVTVTQLAAAGNSGNNAHANSTDVSMRKIYVWEVPHDMSPDKLLSHFSSYGEIEEGPLGFDRFTGKSKGFALFVYKTPEGAQTALANPVKTIDGRQLNCKLANVDGKKGKQGGPPGLAGSDGVHGQVSGTGNDGMGMGMGMGMAQGSIPGSQYGGPGSIGTYGAFPGAPQMGNHPLNSSSLGGPGLSSVNSQASSSLGGTAGYGAGLGGPYGGYGGIGGTSGGLGAAGLGGAAAVGGSSSLYRFPPSSVGMPSGGYPESGHYSLTSSAGYPSQHHQPAGTSPVPRVPPGGGMYPNVPHYF